MGMYSGALYPGAQPMSVFTPPTGWVRWVFETDREVFKQFIKLHEGQVIAFSETIENEQGILTEDFALRYIHKFLGGKYANTDVSTIDLNISDEVLSLYFREPLTSEEAEQVLKYDESKLDDFHTRLLDEKAEDTDGSSMFVPSVYTGISTTMSTGQFSYTFSGISPVNYVTIDVTMPPDGITTTI